MIKTILLTSLITLLSYSGLSYSGLRGEAVQNLPAAPEDAAPSVGSGIVDGKFPGASTLSYPNQKIENCSSLDYPALPVAITEDDEAYKKFLPQKWTDELYNKVSPFLKKLSPQENSLTTNTVDKATLDYAISVTYTQGIPSLSGEVGINQRFEKQFKAQSDDINQKVVVLLEQQNFGEIFSAYGVTINQALVNLKTYPQNFKWPKERGFCWHQDYWSRELIEKPSFTVHKQDALANEWDYLLCKVIQQKHASALIGNAFISQTERSFSQLTASSIIPPEDLRNTQLDNALFQCNKGSGYGLYQGLVNQNNISGYLYHIARGVQVKEGGERTILIVLFKFAETPQ
ncbi:hypothetical protein N9V90_00060 [Endozoicomonas sp.]|nr:hypothetical protein [Endozoicomonas sp.]